MQDIPSIDWVIGIYAKKNDIDYYIIEPQQRKVIKKSYSDNFLKK